jgi:subtilisin-like proprotein convertase family protein
LRWDEVREVMKQCCDKIDTAGGAYDATGRSPKYGWGRLNAAKAVALAVPATPPAHRIVTASARQDIAIRDLQTARLPVQVAEAAPVKALRVTVDIEHTYIGDLLVTLRAPTGSGIAAIVLHDRTGGGTDNLHRTYDARSTPALASVVGKSAAGRWTLVVRDTARLDQGKIRGVSLELSV